MNHGGMHPHPETLYYHTALSALESAKTEQDEFRKRQFIVTALVFSAFCLETFIAQEYAAHSEATLILEDFDRLSLEAKWLMLPLLLRSQKTFDKGSPPFQVFHAKGVKSLLDSCFTEPTASSRVGSQRCT